MSKNNVQIKYFYESEHYTTNNIIEEISEECLNELIKKRICLHIKQGKEITFRFVGVAFYREFVILVLPKYINKDINENEKAKTMGEILRILKVYEKKNTKNKEEEFLISNIENKDVSDFIVADYILSNYVKYGYYEKTDELITLNGEGDIEWNKTIDELYPYFSNNRPYYLDTFNKVKTNDHNNIIKEIHRWAVDFCYKSYGTILGYSNIQFENSVTNLDTLGNKEYLTNILYRELNQTFVDQNIHLIKSLITLISRNSKFSKSNILTLYGTRSFAMVWQDICSFLLGNEIDKYIDEIEKPRWINVVNKLTSHDTDTFKPDIIKTHSLDGKDYFIIFDAKYYQIEFQGKKLFNNPDVNDVAKQLLYEKAFQHKKQKIFRNIFLFPRNHQDVLFEPFGFVNISFIGSNPIILVYVSVQMAINLYLSRSPLSQKEISTFLQSLEEYFSQYPKIIKEL